MMYLSRSLTRLAIIATSSHQNVNADSRLDTIRRTTAAVARASRAAQMLIRIRVLSSHIGCIPGRAHMFCTVDMVYMPAVGSLVHVWALSITFIVELDTVVVIEVIVVICTGDAVVMEAIAIPGMPAISIVVISSSVVSFSGQLEDSNPALAVTSKPTGR